MNNELYHYGRSINDGAPGVGTGNWRRGGSVSSTGHHSNDDNEKRLLVNDEKISVIKSYLDEDGNLTEAGKERYGVGKEYNEEKYGRRYVEDLNEIDRRKAEMSTWGSAMNAINQTPNSFNVRDDYERYIELELLDYDLLACANESGYDIRVTGKKRYSSDGSNTYDDGIQPSDYVTRIMESDFGSLPYEKFMELREEATGNKFTLFASTGKNEKQPYVRDDDYYELREIMEMDMEDRKMRREKYNERRPSIPQDSPPKSEHQSSASQDSRSEEGSSAVPKRGWFFRRSGKKK